MSGPITSSETVLRLRAARDRVIDLLGLGETYPIRDLPVPNDRLRVAFNATATIRVEVSEKQLSYGLRDKDGHPAGNATIGTGDTLALATPAIRDDITYTVHARTPAGREADLFATGNVKVGLDLTIAAVGVAGGRADTAHPRLRHGGNGADSVQPGWRRLPAGALRRRRSGASGRHGGGGP